MIIDCISDLHGHYPELEGGDLLIVAGDLTAKDTKEQWVYYIDWIKSQSDKYKEIIQIAGNHDNYLIDNGIELQSLWGNNWHYLCDSGIELEGLKIWGSPWTKTFEGMNPHCKAFTVDTEEELAEKWALIPDDVDILVTHSPFYGMLDSTILGNHVGSMTLKEKICLINPKLHVFGHIHEEGGRIISTPIGKFVNASHVNEFYKPVNKPVRVIL